MDTEMLTVKLGREELLLLLRIFHAPTLPGLEADPLSGMSAEQVAIALVSAERSLRARGILRFDESQKRIEVEPVTMALVGSCLQPQFSLLVTSRARGEDQKTCFYHVAPHLVIEHSSPDTGVYQFTGVATAKEMLPRIMGTLHLSQLAAWQCPSTRVQESVLLQVRDYAQAGEVEKSRTLLRAAGVADVTAEALIKTLRAPLLNASFVRVEYSQPEAKQVQGFSILEGTDTLWALTPVQAQEGNLAIQIESVSAQTAQDHVRDLLEG